MKYMREGLEDSYGFLALQDKILEVASYVDELCKKNDIEYSLMGGSALGAKRHGGFIPWDDDLDVFMTPANYERFREVFNTEGDKEKFYLQELGATNGMVTTAKVRMNGTTYIESEISDWKMHHGIYIDIFILHTCPNNKLLQLHQCFWAKYVITKGVAIRSSGRHSGIRGFVVKIAKLFPDKFLVKHGLKQVYRYRNKQTKYYCNFLGKAVFKKGIYKREWFDETEYVPFENVQLKASARLHDFLTERFGDYMKVPSADRIKYEQHAWKWDTEKDFSEYVNAERDFSDENRLV